MSNKHGDDEYFGNCDPPTGTEGGLNLTSEDRPGGGPSGEGLAVVVDPVREDSYWRDNYCMRPYVGQDASYEDYGPAYGFGVDAVTRYPGRRFEDIEPEMAHAWTTGGGASLLGWKNARHAARDAWNRLKFQGNPFVGSPIAGSRM
jgi:hypothetical protein